MNLSLRQVNNLDCDCCAHEWEKRLAEALKSTAGAALSDRPPTAQEEEYGLSLEGRAKKAKSQAWRDHVAEIIARHDPALADGAKDDGLRERLMKLIETYPHDEHYSVVTRVRGHDKNKCRRCQIERILNGEGK